MSYGVNRSKKKTTTRRKKRQPSSGRARAAGKAKSRGTSTKRATSARRAPKSSAKKKARKSRSTSTRRARTSKAKKAKAPKKARLYTRYDPETGQKVRVPSDSYEYAAWLSRKPSKKKQTRQALVNDPLGTLGMLGATAGKKAVERAGERAGRSVLVSSRGVLGSAATAAAASATGAALAAAGIIGAAIYGMGRLAEARDVQLGERANAISRQFVATQAAVQKQYRAARWDDVPLDIRTKLVNGYKAAIAKVYSGVHTGVFQPSQQIPYGR